MKYFLLRRFVSLLGMVFAVNAHSTVKLDLNDPLAPVEGDERFCPTLVAPLAIRMFWMPRLSVA